MGKLVAVNGGAQALNVENFEGMYRVARALTNSRLVPEDYRGRPEDALVAIDMGAGLGLSPTQALQRIAVIKGRPAIWGDAIPAVLRSRGFKLREGYTGEGQELTAWAIVTDDEGQEFHAEFSMEDAHTAELLAKKGPWQQYPKRMLKHRARGFAARDSGALIAMYTVEEVRESDLRDITPSQDAVPADIANALKGADEVAPEETLADTIAKHLKNDASEGGIAHLRETYAEMMTPEAAALLDEAEDQLKPAAEPGLPLDDAVAEAEVVGA